MKQNIQNEEKKKQKEKRKEKIGKGTKRSKKKKREKFYLWLATLQKLPVVQARRRFFFSMVENEANGQDFLGFWTTTRLT